MCFYFLLAQVSISVRFPEQCLTRSEALKGLSDLPARIIIWAKLCYAGLTRNPAYASFTEDILGSLEIGKLADFVVLSHDIMSIPASEILKTQVLATVIDGVHVYGTI
jgi:predicted amidohydrolase YtcJ